MSEEQNTPGKDLVPAEQQQENTKEVVISEEGYDNIRTAKEKIEKVLVNWFTDDPVMLGTYCLVEKVASKDQKTLGIDTRSSTPRIKYNPNFINTLSEERLECIMAQEGFKLLLRHPTTRLAFPRNISGLASSVTVTPMSLGPLLNMEGMEDFFPTPKNFGLPEGKFFEEYFRQLMDRKSETDKRIKEIWDSMSDEEKQQMINDAMNNQGQGQSDPNQQPQDGQGQGQDDQNGQGQGQGNQDQDGFEKYDNENDAMKEYFDPNSTNNVDWGTNDLLDADIKSMVDEKKGSSKQWGKYTGEALGDIVAANTPKISWKEIVRRFGRSVMSRRTVPSRMRVNRRYKFDLPGARREYDTKIIFAVDVSGSMSDEDLKEGFAVINSVCGHAEMTYMLFDTKIKSVEKDFKKAKKSFKVTGRGGTDFQEVVDYANEHKADGLVIFTDGYADSPSKPIKTKTLWLLHSKGQSPPVEWGFRAYLDRYEN